MESNQNNNISTNRGSKFLKDIGIYAIGNIGSKVITFLMVPLYTYFVHDTSDFGYYDVCLTVCFLLMPFLTLQLRDGAFRFLLDCDDETRRQRIVTFVSRTMLSTMSLAVLVTIVLALTTHIAYLGYVLALLIAMSLQEVFSQVFRGLGNNRAFVMVGILSAFGIGLFSVLFVAGLNWGIKGIFMAKPLFIKHFIGLEVNGVYAVAMRFTGIISTLAIIFYQAWQETAILQYNSPDRDRFFSKMFNGYIFLLATILVGYVFMLKVNYWWLVADEYRSSIIFIYPLGVSAVIFAVAAFFDMGYQCAKDTKRTLPAIVLAAVVNVVLNLTLIRLIGIYGVIIAQLVTYIVLVVYRWHDMKRYFVLKIDVRVIVPVAVILVSALPFYFSSNYWYDITFMLLALVIIAWSSNREMREMLLSKILK